MKQYNMTHFILHFECRLEDGPRFSFSYKGLIFLRNVNINLFVSEEVDRIFDLGSNPYGKFNPHAFFKENTIKQASKLLEDTYIRSYRQAHKITSKVFEHKFYNPLAARRNFENSWITKSLIEQDRTFLAMISMCEF